MVNRRQGSDRECGVGGVLTGEGRWKGCDDDSRGRQGGKVKTGEEGDRKGVETGHHLSKMTLFYFIIFSFPPCSNEGNLCLQGGV